MTQTTKYPASPAAAARRRAPLDRLLDPDLFKALADPTRARLLACLIKCARPCSVTEVAACCDVDFSVVSRHLAALAREGVLDANRVGRTVWYTPHAEQLATRFRQIADALEDWKPSPDDPSCCPGSDASCCNQTNGDKTE